MPAPQFPFPSKIESLAEPVVETYAQITDDLLINISKRFNVNDLTLGSGEWRLRMLAKMGQLTQENIEIIAKYSGKSTEEVKKALIKASEVALDECEPRLKEAAMKGLLTGATSSPMSPTVKQTVDAFQRQAVDKLNLVNTTMLESSMQVYQMGVNDVWQQAQKTMNTAAGQTVLGTTDRQSAVRHAIKRMADAGITGFYDRAGRRWSAEAYVNMDVGTTVHNTYVQTVMDRNTDYGNDLVYPGIKAVSRPGCYPWQGKVISMTNRSGATTDLNDSSLVIYPVSETTYGEPAGIWGINCGHSCNVFIPGLSIIRGEVPPKSENDEAYAESQAQRQLERNVRYAKRDAMMARESGDTEAEKDAERRVRQAQKDLRSFYDRTGRAKSNGRTTVVGYNGSKSLKGNAAMTNQNGKYILPLNADESKVAEIKSSMTIDDALKLQEEQSGLSYRLYGSKDPMSEWGHAMFADDASSIMGGYGGGDPYAFSVAEKDLTPFSEVDGKIREAYRETKENGALPWYLEDSNEDDFVAMFNPVDIVDSAAGYDDDEMMPWLWENVIEPNGYKGIKTQDGAIVFDSSLIGRNIPLEMVARGEGVVEQVAEASQYAGTKQQVQEFLDFKKSLETKYTGESIWSAMTDEEMDKLNSLERIAYKGN